MAFFQVVAVDLDGTLTCRGQVSDAATDAVKQVQQGGLRAVPVTGRIGVELESEFPDIASLFDGVVLENGAVCLVDGETSPLAAPVDVTLDDALNTRGIPYRRGDVLLAAAEIGVAVANAIPSVQRRADLILENRNGAGVAELLTGPILSRARRWCPPRRWIDIGTFDDRTPT